MTLVTFGEAMLRLSPDGNKRLEVAREYEARVGGAEANAAVAASRLGADAVWISKLPDSPLGKRVAGELHGYGIDPAVVWSDEGRQGLYFLEHGGRPRGTDIVYDRSNAAITDATIEELPTDHLSEADAFLSSGVTPALSTQLAETTANMLSSARDANATTVFDVKYRSGLWPPDEARAMLTRLFPGVDVLLADVQDAREVFDIQDDPPRIAHQLASKWEFDTVVVSRRDGGAVALHDGVVHEQSGFEADTVDPVGAADAFTGAFVARRLAGDDVDVALAEATAMAALKRTIPGEVATVTHDEVRTVVESDDDDETLLSR